jgi:hypothetical protein
MAPMVMNPDRWLSSIQYYLVGADLVVKEYAMPREGALVAPPTRPAR